MEGARRQAVWFDHKVVFCSKCCLGGAAYEAALLSPVMTRPLRKNEGEIKSMFLNHKQSRVSVTK